MHIGQKTSTLTFCIGQIKGIFMQKKMILFSENYIEFIFSLAYMIVLVLYVFKPKIFLIFCQRCKNLFRYLIVISFSLIDTLFFNIYVSLQLTLMCHQFHEGVLKQSILCNIVKGMDALQFWPDVCEWMLFQKNIQA